MAWCLSWHEFLSFAKLHSSARSGRTVPVGVSFVCALDVGRVAVSEPLDRAAFSQVRGLRPLVMSCTARILRKAGSPLVKQICIAAMSDDRSLMTRVPKKIGLLLLTVFVGDNQRAAAGKKGSTLAQTTHATGNASCLCAPMQPRVKKYGDVLARPGGAVLNFIRNTIETKQARSMCNQRCHLPALN